ncbi:C2H2 type zinc-finger-domain-containing protein [Phycomyces nitens]|nr:C2H2 type zinc-finger-domain-containing protein [Phycomyces nitens]
MSKIQQQSIPTREVIVPKSTVYTCLACQVAFPTSEKQRAHYRTDWHKYNLKRKIAELVPVDAEQFAQKVLAQQAVGREEEERSSLIYECPTCKKSYGSENAYHNHVQSRKHQEAEQKLLQGASALARVQHEGRLFSDHSDMEDEEISMATKNNQNPALNCIFCNHSSKEFGSNLDHMFKEHGFFLPDKEYLKDVEGLVVYLASKVNNGICLYCNGRGKEWKSVEAVRGHMNDKGHCKMAYDDTEDPEQLLAFYDFGPFDEESLSEPDQQFEHQGSDALILANGTRIGHRKFMKYFKQHHAYTPPAEEEVKAIEGAKEETKPEPMNRRERRANLTITDGHEVAAHNTACGIKELALQQEYKRRIDIKSNLVNRRRARKQVPI